MRRFALAVVATTGCAQLVGIPEFGASTDAGVGPAPDALPITSTYAAAVMADVPVGYYHLDEPMGVEAYDATGGSSGTYVGGAVIGQPGAFPTSGTSVSLNGTSAAVLLGDRFKFIGTAGFSLEAWIKPHIVDGDFHQIGSRWQDPPMRDGYTWFQSGSDFGFERDGGSGNMTQLGYDGVFVSDKWSYVVVTYDGVTMTFFLDGVQRKTMGSSIPVIDVGIPAMIGAADGSNVHTPFDGDIDEYAIYDHALTAERVNAHFLAANN